MLNLKQVSFSLWGSVLALCVAASAQATQIEFTSIDLADTTAGEDLWLYEYRVSDYNFPANFGFSIYFDLGSYGAIVDVSPTSAGPDWEVLTLQPDEAIPADGLYDALALVDNASLAAAFRVSFVWFGGVGVAPGIQPFEINQFDSLGGLLGVVETGTTSPVPEPNTAMLLGLGLVTLATLKTRPPS